jgi:hypothetical protein
MLTEWLTNFRERYSANITTEEDVQEQLEGKLDIFIERYEDLHDAVSAFDCPEPAQKARSLLLNYLAKQEPLAETLKLYYRANVTTKQTELMVKTAEVELLREQFIAEYNRLVEESS